MQSFVALVTPIGAHGLGDLRPDNTLPGQPVYPTTGPIYGGGYPSHGLPGQPVDPGWGGGRPPMGGTLPIYGGGRPDNSLPGQGGGGGSTLPVWNPIYGWFLMQLREHSDHPDAGLPETPEPK